ncbi:hypothetical protein B0E45_22280 [Sinorhizobium sp. A49]|uniref:GNAT family N-acetyltransferase n=1 Tax=Sinorhizobium sp. A49 TaxID=1945861 RepID=UPI0009872184|nr:GNAT family protein [Sinorhizobium sp. A49]OOG67394.1 hypothetical protein B0E45_22280 [Sinorhizobium sp. A49]
MPDCRRHFLACFFIGQSDVAHSAQISDHKISTNADGIGGKRDAKRIDQGLGMAATKLVLAHAFSAFALRHLSLRVLAVNVREAVVIGGEWHDDMMTEIPASEFSGPKDTPQGK